MCIRGKKCLHKRILSLRSPFWGHQGQRRPVGQEVDIWIWNCFCWIKFKEYPTFCLNCFCHFWGKIGYNQELPDKTLFEVISAEGGFWVIMYNPRILVLFGEKYFSLIHISRSLWLPMHFQRWRITSSTLNKVCHKAVPFFSKYNSFVKRRPRIKGNLLDQVKRVDSNLPACPVA